MKQFGLSDKEIKFLNDVFNKHIGQFQFQIWIFGSRATGSAKKYSDIDLLIECPQLTTAVVSKISEDLEESNLPFKVDLVDVRKLAPEYAESVHSSKKLLFRNTHSLTIS